MKINLLLNPANRSWIIQKIAENLARDLEGSGVATSISDTVDDSADLVHHMSWAFANVQTRQPSTMFITHLDDLFKLNQVRAMLEREVKVGICMSSDTMRQLQQHGCRPQSLCYISPAHDGGIPPRRIVIGITSRVYPDGRKREAVLQEVARRMDLSAFEFRIFGLGWDETNEVLRAAGAQVAYFGETDDFRKDYETLQAAIPHFDYYLYLGMDEGSLGTLDALAAGVATIVTPQGFHLDLPDGITHPVISADDLAAVFAKVQAERQTRIAAVSGLTWAHYARSHAEVWQAILAEAPLPVRASNTVAAPSALVSAMEAQRRAMARRNALSPRRMLSALSHHPLLKPARRHLDSLRLRRNKG